MNKQEYDFDSIIERRQTGSAKWDQLEQTFQRSDVLPFSAADMDFPVPDEITAAIRRRGDHRIFGYSIAPESYYLSIAGWLLRRFQWNIQTDWLLDSPNIIVSIMTGILAFSSANAKVLIQTPVYNGFPDQIQSLGRQVICNPLAFIHGRYEIDFEDFEKKAADPETELFLLCSPHNPVGRVWSREELKRMGHICQKHHVFVISDEIHWDIVFPPHRHTPFTSLDGSCFHKSITLISTGKTFNLSGMMLSGVVIPDKEIRSTFRQKLYEHFHYNFVPPLSTAAVEAAYVHGDRWLEELNSYLWDNFLYLEDFLQSYLPRIKLIRPEGTYLAWLDARDLGMEPQQLQHWLIHTARLGVFEGSRYGPEGSGFIRMNIACPRSLLEQGLLRLREAAQTL